MCDQINPSLWMHVLHNLHGRDVGFHCLTALLNSVRLSSRLILRAKISLIFGQGNFIASMPMKTLCNCQNPCLSFMFKSK